MYKNVSQLKKKSVFLFNYHIYLIIFQYIKAIIKYITYDLLMNKALPVQALEFFFLLLARGKILLGSFTNKKETKKGPN